MKILIADDDALIRDSLKILLELEEDMEIVATAPNGQEAFEICQNKQVDLVLMDIRMPVMDGVLATKKIKQSFKDIKVVVLTTFKDDEYIKEALKNGAEGYILKSQSSDNIIESIRTVNCGNMVFERDVAQRLTSMLKDDQPKKAMDIQITEREREVLDLVSQGLSNKEIAKELYLSEGTVRNYVTGLLEKFSLRDRTQLAIYYIKNFT